MKKSPCKPKKYFEQKYIINEYPKSTVPQVLFRDFNCRNPFKLEELSAASNVGVIYTLTSIPTTSLRITASNIGKERPKKV